MVKARVWRLVRRPAGKPCEDDFVCVEEEVPACSDGEVLVEAVALSVDPYMRYKARQIPLNSTMFGSQVARVIESKNPKWPVGTHLVHYEGWRTHTLLTPQSFLPDSIGLCATAMPEMGDLPKSLGIGIIGMPGITAYFGFLDICHPKAGETVLVNGAAGAVGSAVVQIAKIKGCTVIAFAGSDKKVEWLKELGADHAFNYKTTNVHEALSRTAPKGINNYFDNVGGLFTAQALPHMAEYGRVSLCGAIATYNDDSKDLGKMSLTSPLNEGDIIWKQLRIEGFLASRWGDRLMEGLMQLKEWIVQGKLKYKETIYEGFEKMPSAFAGLFDGDNIGKAVVLP